MSTLEEIEKVFGRGSYFFSDIDEICDDPYYGLEYGDFETMDAVSPYLNKKFSSMMNSLSKSLFSSNTIKWNKGRGK